MYSKSNSAYFISCCKKEYRDQGIGSYILNDLAKQYDSKKDYCRY